MRVLPGFSQWMSWTRGESSCYPLRQNDQKTRGEERRWEEPRDDRRSRRREVEEQQVTGRPGQAPHSSQTGSKTSAHLMEINKEVITWRLSHGALPLPTQPLKGACQFPFKFNFSPVIKVLATKSVSTNERNGSSFLVRFERHTTYYSWLGLVNSHGDSANSI